MKKIVVVSGGGHAKVVISILRKLKEYQIIGYTDIEDKGKIFDVSYLGNDEEFLKKNENIKYAAIGIGQIKKYKLRKKIIENYLINGFDFPVIISPDAIVNEQVEIGKGTVVMDGVVINTGTKIGEFCIINTKSSIDHECCISDYIHIAPGTTLSGTVEILDNTLIGIGSIILQGKTIGKNCIVGAASVITKSFDDNLLICGNPAKVIKLLDH